MNRPMPTIAATLAALALGLALATGADAVPVETSTDLNLRTGPGVRYPVVGTMPRGAVVELAGCEGSWCVVSYRGVRGWASGRYLVRIPFRPAPAPEGGFLSRLFQRNEPLAAPPLAPAPDLEPARPIAPPPARTETPREPATRTRRPAEERASEPSGRPTGRGTTAPGILSESMPTVRVPLPGEVEDAEPDATGRSGSPAQPSRSAPQGDADAATPEENATGGAPRRLRRDDATGADVL